MIRARVFALAVFAAGTAHAETVGPFDGVLTPTPPRAGDTLQLGLSNAGSCLAPLPAAVEIRRAGADLEVRVGGVDHCSPSAPAQSRDYALGVLAPDVERVVVFSCAGNPPPGAPACSTAFSIATAGAIAGQDVSPVPATSPAQLALLAVMTLLAGLVAMRRTVAGLQ